MENLLCYALLGLELRREPLAGAMDKEQYVRVRSALQTSGLPVGALGPSTDAPRAASSTDLARALALGPLAPVGGLKAPLPALLPWAELSLDGRLRPCPGVVSAALEARALGAVLLVPHCDRANAELVPGCRIAAFSTLAEVAAWLRGCTQAELEVTPKRLAKPMPMPGQVSWSDVDPRLMDLLAPARIAVARGEHVLLVAAPGCGKTMVARRLLLDLPELDNEEQLSSAQAYSAAGILQDGKMTRPFRAPHHTCSMMALLGGGSGTGGRPGEVTLAHGGVLYLDELPEFQRATLDALARIIPQGLVQTTSGSRPGQSAFPITFPARFVLVASAMPCPCGYLGHPSRKCACGTATVARYMDRIKPLLPFFSVRVDMPVLLGATR